MWASTDMLLLGQLHQTKARIFCLTLKTQMRNKPRLCAPVTQPVVLSTLQTDSLRL